MLAAGSRVLAPPGPPLPFPFPLPVPQPGNVSRGAEPWGAGLSPCPSPLQVWSFRFVLCNEINFYTSSACTHCPVSRREQHRCPLPELCKARGTLGCGVRGSHGSEESPRAWADSPFGDSHRMSGYELKPGPVAQGAGLGSADTSRTSAREGECQPAGRAGEGGSGSPCRCHRLPAPPQPAPQHRAALGAVLPPLPAPISPRQLFPHLFLSLQALPRALGTGERGRSLSQHLSGALPRLGLAPGTVKAPRASPLPWESSPELQGWRGPRCSCCVWDPSGLPGQKWVPGRGDAAQPGCGVLALGWSGAGAGWRRRCQDGRDARCSR